MFKYNSVVVRSQLKRRTVIELRFSDSLVYQVENSRKRMLLQRKVICTIKASEYQNRKRFYIIYLNIQGQIPNRYSIKLQSRDIFVS